MSRWYKVKGYEPKKPQQGAVRNNDEYKIIALDIDGTLTNEEKKITPKTRKALIAAEKRGIRLILASGRPIAGLRELAKELEMDKYHGILIGFNGGTVLQSLVRSGLESKRIKEIRPCDNSGQTIIILKQGEK